MSGTPRAPRHPARLIAGLLAGLLLATPGRIPAAELVAARPPAPPTSWSLGLRSSGYFRQTEAEDGATTDHLETFHLLSGNVTGLAGGHLALRGSGRLANDRVWMLPGHENARLYTGHLEARFTSDLRARVGRQLVNAGATHLTLDGASLRWRVSPRWQVEAWGGTRAPLGHAFTLGDLDETAAMGGRLAFRPDRRWRVAVSAAHREQGGRVAARPAELELGSRALPHTDLVARGAYDLESERWARLHAQARWQRPGRGTAVTVQFVDRHPLVDATSWFARFGGLKRIRVLRAGVQHRLPSGFGGEVAYLGSFVGERRSSRVGLAVLAPGARVGYVLRGGDAGEEGRLYGEVGGRVTRWLWLDGHATLLTYALVEDAPSDLEGDLSTLALRARADLRPGLRLVAELQRLTNPAYDSDVRVLVGVDLAMARGATRAGLDRGGWLR